MRGGPKGQPLTRDKGKLKTNYMILKELYFSYDRLTIECPPMPLVYQAAGRESAFYGTFFCKAFAWAHG